MPEGSKFWFTSPPEFDIVEEVIEKAAQLKADSKEESIEYFAKVKQMSVDVFLTIYIVEECKI